MPYLFCNILYGSESLLLLNINYIIIFTGDYYGRSFVYVSTRINVRITTRDDNILEYNETFAVSISPDLIHNSTAAADCITTVNVVIIDDDHRKLPRTVSPFMNHFGNKILFFTYLVVVVI